MKIIGITGGVGSGKSAVLHILETEYQAHVMEADKTAHLLMEPGGESYRPILAAFGSGIAAPDGSIDRTRLGAIVFGDEKKLQLLNQITHPIVRSCILKEIEAYRASYPRGLFVLEAALLLEEGYDRICDVLWYIYADEETRIQRLMESRGYTREKCLSMMKNQSDEAFYRKGCQIVINNSHSLKETKKQIDNLLKK